MRVHRFIQVKWGPPRSEKPLQEPALEVPTHHRFSTRTATLAASPQARTLNFPAKAGAAPLSQRLSFTKAQGTDAQGGSLVAESIPMSLDEMLAQQKRLLEQMSSSDITAEKKAQLKKEFAALHAKSKAVLKKQQEKAAIGGSTETQHGKSPASAQASTPVRHLNTKPKTLLLSNLHADLQFEGLLRSHFATFGQVLEVVPVENDASKW
jgi:hypothetical protein